MTGAMVVLDYIDSYGARRSRVLMGHPFGFVDGG